MFIINIIGIGFIAIFLFFILIKDKKRTDDYLLVLLNIILINGLLADATKRLEYSGLSFVFHLLIPYYIPCFTLYALVLIEPEHRLRKRWWWILALASVYPILALVDFTMVHDFNTSFVEELYTRPALHYQILYNWQTAFALYLLFWLLPKLGNYLRNIKANYSFIEHFHLKWVRTFIYINILLNIMIIGVLVFLSLGYLEDIDSPFLLINSLLILSVIYLSYHGIKQYNLAEFDVIYRRTRSAALPETQRATKEVAPENEKYKSSSLSEDEMTDILDRITTLFENDKVYLEPQLKLADLAGRLGVSTHYISQTINHKSKQSFYDFVNGYRMAHFKELLSNPDNNKYTVLALGLESGFNSKASINRIFRQHLGVSPSEYQKQHAALKS